MYLIPIKTRVRKTHISPALCAKVKPCKKTDSPSSVLGRARAVRASDVSDVGEKYQPWPCMSNCCQFRKMLKYHDHFGTMKCKKSRPGFSYFIQNAIYLILCGRQLDWVPSTWRTGISLWTILKKGHWTEQVWKTTHAISIHCLLKIIFRIITSCTWYSQPLYKMCMCIYISLEQCIYCWNIVLKI